jgi:hypothetical protein
MALPRLAERQVRTLDDVPMISMASHLLQVSSAGCRMQITCTLPNSIPIANLHRLSGALPTTTSRIIPCSLPLPSAGVSIRRTATPTHADVLTGQAINVFYRAAHRRPNGAHSYNITHVSTLWFPRIIKHLAPNHCRHVRQCLWRDPAIY